jgi:AraC-like DNA-binding protein
MAKTPSPFSGWQSLAAVTNRLRFEPHALADRVDEKGRYREDFSAELPLLVRLFEIGSRKYTPGLNWHERLELFLPVEGKVILQSGQRQIKLDPGDLLVMDHLTPHGPVDFPGFSARVVVVSFASEFVFSLGSATHDYVFLLPFAFLQTDAPRIVRRGNPAASELHAGLAKLLTAYFDTGSPIPLRAAACKARLLHVLYDLAREFPADASAMDGFRRKQENMRRMAPVLEWVRNRLAEKLTLEQAARKAGLSIPRFTRVFRESAGVSFVRYVNQARLQNAAALLRETAMNVAEVAQAAGFSDQSYLDRLFKRSFGASPTAYRCRWRRSAAIPG